MQYSTKEFNLPEIDGLSQKQIEVHLGLYDGYVKNVNKLQEQIAQLKDVDTEKYSYAITETRRRLGFEFNGMRMHEYYFNQLEASNTKETQDEELIELISKEFGTWDSFINEFKKVGMTRGIGWTILYYDKNAEALYIAWVADHELGQLGGLKILLAMDMWEHAFMVDYTPAQKAEYIDAYLNNVNFGVMDTRYNEAKNN